MTQQPISKPVDLDAIRQGIHVRDDFGHEIVERLVNELEHLRSITRDDAYDLIAERDSLRLRLAAATEERDEFSKAHHEQSQQLAQALKARTEADAVAASYDQALQDAGHHVECLHRVIRDLGAGLLAADEERSVSR